MKSKNYCEKLIFLGVFLIGIQIQSAYGYEPKDAANNFAHELTVCAAFYSISADALKKKEETLSGGPVISDKYAKAGEDFLKLALKLSPQDVTTARYEMAIKEMMSDINNDYTKISILMNKYFESCKSLHENPEARLNYWLEKK